MYKHVKKLTLHWVYYYLMYYTYKICVTYKISIQEHSSFWIWLSGFYTVFLCIQTLYWFKAENWMFGAFFQFKNVPHNGQYIYPQNTSTLPRSDRWVMSSLPAVVEIADSGPTVTLLKQIGNALYLLLDVLWHDS